jgi:hypothetical protein
MSEPTTDSNDPDPQEASAAPEGEAKTGDAQPEAGGAADDAPAPLRTAYAALRAMLSARSEKRER